MKNRKTIIIVVVILLIALGIYFLFKDDTKNMNQAGSSSAAMSFKNIDMTESKDGQLIYRFKAKDVNMSRDQNEILLTGVEGSYFKDGDELHLVGDRGKIDRKKKTVYIEGNVHGTNKAGEELYAENLTYDGNKEILSTDKFFTATKDHKVLTGDSFTADRIIQVITAKGHAKLADKEDTK